MEPQSQAPPESRVLVVDERREERSWLQQVLSGVARLETCESAEAALDLVASSPPDLVVWGTPAEIESGPRLAARLRREHPSVGVVLLAQESAAESLRESHPHAAFVLVRPVAALELRQVVEHVLTRRRLDDRVDELTNRVRTAERCQVLAASIRARSIPRAWTCCSISSAGAGESRSSGGPDPSARRWRSGASRRTNPGVCTTC